MSGKKRNKAGKAAPDQRPSVVGSRNKNSVLVAAAVIIGVVVLAVALNGYKPKGVSAGAGGSSKVPAEEQKYLGRFLPAGYAETKVAEPTKYSSVIGMSPVTASSDASGLAIPLADVVSKKIVSFDAQKDGKKLAMIAFVKPSGKLFVGVSYCPPCQGEGQRIEPDGTLTCETCGTKRDLEADTGISGACKLYPLDELPVSVQGDKITVAQAAIDGWSQQPTDRPVGQ